MHRILKNIDNVKKEYPHITISTNTSAGVYSCSEGGNKTISAVKSFRQNNFLSFTSKIKQSSFRMKIKLMINIAFAIMTERMLELPYPKLPNIPCTIAGNGKK